jgi:hypothetical protein
VDGVIHVLPKGRLSIATRMGIPVLDDQRLRNEIRWSVFDVDDVAITTTIDAPDTVSQAQRPDDLRPLAEPSGRYRAERRKRPRR